MLMKNIDKLEENQQSCTDGSFVITSLEIGQNSNSTINVNAINSHNLDTSGLQQNQNIMDIQVIPDSQQHSRIMEIQIIPEHSKNQKAPGSYDVIDNIDKLSDEQIAKLQNYQCRKVNILKSLNQEVTTCKKINIRGLRRSPIFKPDSFFSALPTCDSQEAILIWKLLTELTKKRYSNEDLCILVYEIGADMFVGTNVEIPEKGYLFNHIIKLWTEMNDVTPYLIRYVEIVIEAIIAYHLVEIGNQDILNPCPYKESLEAKYYNIKDKITSPSFRSIFKTSAAIKSFYDPDFEDRLNSIPYLLPIKGNSILELKTGNIRPRTYEDMFSGETTCEYGDPNDPEMLQILNDAVLDDPNLLRLLQIVCGIALTGETGKMIVIFTGSGNNGKSNIVEIVYRILGKTFATVCSKNLFVKAAHGFRSDDPNGHSTAIHQLCKKRYGYFCETDKDDSYNSGLLKQLTGGDNVKSREMYGKGDTFKSMLKLFGATNNDINSDRNDHAIHERLIKFPLPVQYVDYVDGYVLKSFERFKNHDISNVINRLLPHFFAFFAEGARIWYENNMNLKMFIPQSILDVRQEHIDDMKALNLNPYDLFIDSCLVFHDNRKSPHKYEIGMLWDLYKIYTKINHSATILSGKDETAFKGYLRKIYGHYNQKVDAHGSRQVNRWLCEVNPDSSLYKSREFAIYLENESSNPEYKIQLQEHYKSILSKLPNTYPTQPIRSNSIQGTSTIKPIQPNSTTPIQPNSTTPIQPNSTTPIQPNSTTPIQTNSTTPIQTNSTTPIQTNSTTPIQTNSTTPIQTNSTTPIQTINNYTMTPSLTSSYSLNAPVINNYSQPSTITYNSSQSINQYSSGNHSMQSTMMTRTKPGRNFLLYS
jgi:hypothetical protein